jgi:hypothetical protein
VFIGDVAPRDAPNKDGVEANCGGGAKAVVEAVPDIGDLAGRWPLTPMTTTEVITTS